MKTVSFTIPGRADKQGTDAELLLRELNAKGVSVPRVNIDIQDENISTTTFDVECNDRDPRLDLIVPEAFKTSGKGKTACRGSAKKARSQMITIPKKQEVITPEKMIEHMAELRKLQCVEFIYETEEAYEISLRENLTQREYMNGMIEIMQAVRGAFNSRRLDCSTAAPSILTTATTFVETPGYLLVVNPANPLKLTRRTPKKPLTQAIKKPSTKLKAQGFGVIYGMPGPIDCQLPQRIYKAFVDGSIYVFPTLSEAKAKAKGSKSGIPYVAVCLRTNGLETFHGLYRFNKGKWTLNRTE